MNIFEQIGILLSTIALAISGLIIPVEQLKPIGAVSLTIEQKLIGKTVKEKATIKGQEIAKIDFRGEYVSVEYGIKIDIQNIKAIDGGVEVFARAWKGGKQYGFGKDGTIDIERFVIINPPILVDDSNGNIIRDRGEFGLRILKEDAKEALFQVLAHTIFVKKQKFGDENIIVGKIGNTTLIVHPNAGSGSAPIDGTVARHLVNEPYSTIRNGAGTFHSDTGDPDQGYSITASATTDQFATLQYFIGGFDTSSIGTDDVDSATLSGYTNTAQGAIDLGDLTINVAESSPVDEGAFANSDYDLFGTTQFATGISVSTLIASATYKDFTLNSSGEAYINKSGNTMFSFLSEGFIANSFGGTWSSGDKTNWLMETADETGTTKDPKLVVEHSSITPDSSITSDLIMFE